MTANPSEYQAHPASFRDPSGFVFQREGCWYRQVSRSFREHYQFLFSSGLYTALREKDLLIAHEEIAENLTGHPDWYLTLRPEQLPFLSYPEEWSPAQLRDAADCTLTILQLAISHGMILKDATPRNIQFLRGKPIFIDSLSFEKYDPTLPWIAYRQFCETFLYPLFLHHYRGWGTHKTIIAWPEGIPARITLGSLPYRSRLRLSTWLHVFLPARVASDEALKTPAAPSEPSQRVKHIPAFSQQKLLQSTAYLQSVIRKLRIEGEKNTGWSNYYEVSILSQAYLQEKEKLFSQYISGLPFETALDLGANDGYFSRIMAEKAKRVVAADADWKCIQHGYLLSRSRQLPNLYPLCVDLANPTPSSGFHHREKTSFTERAVSDLVAALALVHHLVLAQNIPLPLIASWMSDLTRRWLIIEFVPVEDSKATELLLHKKIYPGPYDAASFEASFLPCFDLVRKAIIPGTQRALYLYQKKLQG